MKNAENVAEKKSKQMTSDIIKKIAFAGIMAALCYVGYSVFPAFSVTGTKVHLGNTFVVLGALLLGGLYGGLAGAVGLTIADLAGGYAASAPRTFICKLVIGLVAGLIAHQLGKLPNQKAKGKIVLWTVIAAYGSLLVNCIFEPALKYVWFTLLTPDPDKAASAIKTMVALTTYTTYINAAINGALAIVFYLALRPAFKKMGIIPRAGELKK